MRILIVSHGFPPFAQGGAEIYAHAHAKTFAELGDEVFVITREADPRRPEYAVRLEQRAGMTLAWINNTFAEVRSFSDGYRHPRIGAEAARLIARFNPDVAHVHHLTCLSTTIVDMLASRNVPVFFTLHDYWLLCHRGQLLDVNLRVCPGPEADGCGDCLGAAASASDAAYRVRSVLARALPRTAVAALAGVFSRAAPDAGTDRGAAASTERLAHMREATRGVTHFFAPSRFMRDRFIAAGVDPERISVSQYGFAPADRLPGSQRREGVLRLGFLGSLMVSKAPHLIIEACDGLPCGAVTVDLYGEPVDYHGDDRYRTEMQRWTNRPWVRTHGRVPNSDIRSVFDRIDALVVPSIWPENSPLVIREAFLAGVPVVASRIGGIPETVTDGVNGLLFEPGSAADLRRVLSQLIDEPGALARLRRGIPPVRTLADDVAWTRDCYQRAITATAKPARMAAVVLNYRTPDDTFLAARALLLSHRHIDFIFVVDNDASDECRRAVETLGDRVTYLRTDRNLGFSGGMNVGIRAALARSADRVLLVNSDVIVPADCVGHLDRALNTTGRGVAGPVLLARHSPDRVASAGITYDARTGRMRHREVGLAFRDQLVPGVLEAAAVSGSLMLITRETLDRVGLFDEQYFFSFEDLDFCLRANAAGLRSVVVGDAVAFHEGGRSMGARSPRRLYFAARNHLRLARDAPRASSSIGRMARTGIVVGLNLAHAVRAPGGSLQARLGAVMRGTRDYFAGRFGAGPVAATSPSDHI